jgi:hypothetical protein
MGSSSSVAVQSRVPGTSVPWLLWAADIFSLVSSDNRLPRWGLAMASLTCGVLGLPRLAAAIFALRAGSPAFAWALALASTAAGS